MRKQGAAERVLSPPYPENVVSARVAQILGYRVLSCTCLIPLGTGLGTHTATLAFCAPGEQWSRTRGFALCLERSGEPRMRCSLLDVPVVDQVLAAICAGQPHVPQELVRRVHAAGRAALRGR